MSFRMIRGGFYVNVKHIVDGDHTPGETTLQQFDDSDLRRCNKPYDGAKSFLTQ